MEDVKFEFDDKCNFISIWGLKFYKIQQNHKNVWIVLLVSLVIIRNWIQGFL